MRCKICRVGNLLICCLSESLVFCEQKSDSLVIKSKLLHAVALLSWAAGANRSQFLFCKERRDQDPSFLKSDKSVSLPWLFKKEGLSEERRERFTFAHKNGEKLSKTYNKMFFLEWITCFLRAIRSNHEWITDVTLFKRNWEQFVLVAL